MPRLFYNPSLVKEHEIEDIASRTSRIRTLLLKIFNNMNRDLKFTLELPEDFEGQWLPTLDTSLKLENGRMSYRFFEKSMSSKYCMMRSSAISWTSKMATLTQEVRRRCLNTDQGLDIETRNEILLKFWDKVRRSGFSKEETLRIFSDGLMGFERMKRSSKGSLHRDMSKGRMERILKKMTGKCNWYRKKTTDLNPDPGLHRGGTASGSIPKPHVGHFLLPPAAKQQWAVVI